MRLLITTALATAMLLVSAATASAVSFTFNITGGAAVPGSNLDLEIVMDTEGIDTQAWFLDVFHTGNTASAVSQPAFFFLNGALFAPLAAPTARTDSSGQFNAAQSAGGGTGTIPVTTVIGTISFANLAPGTISIDVSAAGGAVGGPNGVDLVAAGLVTFDSITIVPEPTTALLVGLGLVGLGVAGRRK